MKKKDYLKTEKTASWCRWIIAVATILLLNVSLSFTGQAQNNYLPPGCEASKGDDVVYYDMYFDADIGRALATNEIRYINVGKDFPTLNVGEIIIKGDYEKGFIPYQIKSVELQKDVVILTVDKFDPVKLMPDNVKATMDPEKEMPNFVSVQDENGIIQNYTTDKRYYDKHSTKSGNENLHLISDKSSGSLAAGIEVNLFDLTLFNGYTTRQKSEGTYVKTGGNYEKVEASNFDGTLEVKFVLNEIYVKTNTTIDYEWTKNAWGKLENLSILKKGTSELKLDATIDFDFIGSYDLGKRKLGFVYFTSPVPCSQLLISATLIPYLDYGSIAGQIGGTIRTGGQTTCTSEYGIEYNKATGFSALGSPVPDVTFGLYNGDPQSVNNLPTISINGEVFWEPGVRVRTQVTLLSVIKVTLDPKSYLKFNFKGECLGLDSLNFDYGVAWCPLEVDSKIDYFNLFNRHWTGIWTKHLYTMPDILIYPNNGGDSEAHQGNPSGSGNMTGFEDDNAGDAYLSTDGNIITGVDPPGEIGISSFVSVNDYDLTLDYQGTVLMDPDSGLTLNADVINVNFINDLRPVFTFTAVPNAKKYQLTIGDLVYETLETVFQPEENMPPQVDAEISVTAYNDYGRAGKASDTKRINIGLTVDGGNSFHGILNYGNQVTVFDPGTDKTYDFYFYDYENNSPPTPDELLIQIKDHSSGALVDEIIIYAGTPVRIDGMGLFIYPINLFVGTGGSTFTEIMIAPYFPPSVSIESPTSENTNDCYINLSLSYCGKDVPSTDIDPLSASELRTLTYNGIGGPDKKYVWNMTGEAGERTMAVELTDMFGNQISDEVTVYFDPDMPLYSWIKVKNWNCKYKNDGSIFRCSECDESDYDAWFSLCTIEDIAEDYPCGASECTSLGLFIEFTEEMNSACNCLAARYSLSGSMVAIQFLKTDYESTSAFLSGCSSDISSSPIYKFQIIDRLKELMGEDNVVIVSNYDDQPVPVAHSAMDTEIPVISVTSHTNGDTIRQTLENYPLNYVTISGTASDNYHVRKIEMWINDTDTFSIWNNMAKNVNWSHKLPTAVLLRGNNTISVRATDLKGLSSVATFSLTWDNREIIVEEEFIFNRGKTTIGGNTCNIGTWWRANALLDLFEFDPEIAKVKLYFTSPTYYDHLYMYVCKGDDPCNKAYRYALPRPGNPYHGYFTGWSHVINHNTVRMAAQRSSERSYRYCQYSISKIAYVKAVPANCVAKYTMDNIINNTLYDETKNINDGTITGATRTTDCVSGDHALSFDGVNDYVYIDDSESLDLIDDAFTVNLWVYLDEYKNINYLIHKNDDRPGIRVNSSGGISFVHAPNNTYTNASSCGFTSTTVLPLKTWCFISYTWDSNEEMMYGYLNGELIGSLHVPDDGSFIPGSRLMIGGDGNSLRYHKGKIDEVTIYDRALTAEEIAEHFDAYDTGDGGDGGFLVDFEDDAYHIVQKNPSWQLYNSGSPWNGKTLAIAYTGDQLELHTNPEFIGKDHKLVLGVLNDRWEGYSVSIGGWTSPVRYNSQHSSPAYHEEIEITIPGQYITSETFTVTLNQGSNSDRYITCYKLYGNTNDQDFQRGVNYHWNNGWTWYGSEWNRKRLVYMTSGNNKPITMHTSDPSKAHTFYLTVLDDRASAFHIKVGSWTSETVITPQNGGSPFEELAVEIPANVISSNNFDVIVYNDFSGNNLYTIEARLVKNGGGSALVDYEDDAYHIGQNTNWIYSHSLWNGKALCNTTSSATITMKTRPEYMGSDHQVILGVLNDRWEGYKISVNGWTSPERYNSQHYSPTAHEDITFTIPGEYISSTEFDVTFTRAGKNTNTTNYITHYQLIANTSEQDIIRGVNYHWKNGWTWYGSEWNRKRLVYMTSGANKPISMHTSDPSKTHVFYLTVLDDRASAFHIKVGDWTSETVTTPQNGGSPFEELAIEIPANTIPSNNFDVIVYNDFSGNRLYTIESRLVCGVYSGGSSKGTANTDGEETVTEISQVEETGHLLVYPNPMSNELSIEYDVQSAGMVTIDIYDITGRLVQTLTNAYTLPGEHTVQWNANDTKGTEMPNGTYFIRMQTGENAQTTKVILMR